MAAAVSINRTIQMPPMKLLCILMFLFESINAFTSSNARNDIRRQWTTSLKALNRRQYLELTIGGIGLGVSYAETRQRDPTDYGLWGIVPVGPYKRKKTVMETIIDGQLWTMDQKFGILNVQVPLRMTIVRLRDYGLLIYNPIAATDECVAMIRQLESQYGKVKHIVVGSVALEHKAYAGVLGQKLKDAKIWCAPGQYSFPVNLPQSWLGYPSDRTFPMPNTPEEYPKDWKNDIELATLGPIISRDGAFSETVLLHKPTKTLLVTDTALVASNQVPPTFQDDPAPLLYHARNDVNDILPDTPETRAQGWRRIVLFGLFFTPSAITIDSLDKAIQERRPQLNSDFAGIYPWQWDIAKEQDSWRALQGTGGKPLVAPILQTLLLNRNPVEVLDFADTVSQWNFERIIPAHLQNNIAANGQDYRQAFGFLETSGVPKGFPKPLEADLQLLRDANENLLASGAIAPVPPLVGGSLSRADIITQTTYQCRAGECMPRAKE